jgi:hypothetical protein
VLVTCRQRSRRGGAAASSRPVDLTGVESVVLRMGMSVSQKASAAAAGKEARPLDGIRSDCGHSFGYLP